MSWLHALRHRLRVRLDPERYARERAQELRFHFAMEARHGGRDARPTGARRDALSPDPFRHPDQERGPMRLSVLDWLRQDLSYALRGIARSPGFTAMVVVTLALGVGANAAVFSLLDRVLGQPPAGVRDAGQLRRLYIDFPERVTDQGVVYAFRSWNFPAYTAVKEAAGGAADLIAWTPSTARPVRYGDAELSIQTAFVSHDYFAVLGVEAAWGRLLGMETERVDVPEAVAVISHGLWKSAFGLDPAMVGRSLEWNDRHYTVVGVAAEGFSGLDLSRTDLFLPLSAFGFTGAQGTRPGVPWHEGDGNFLRAVARLHPGVQEGQLAARATPAYRVIRQSQRISTAPDRDSAAVLLAGPIIEARGPTEPSQALSISARVAGVTAIVLLIACANVAGLLLVRATRRRREIAVRLALGISRRRLLFQILTESLVLAALAGGAAVLFAVWGGGVLRSLLMPAVAWAGPAVDARTAAFALATAVLVGLVAGMAPAAQARRTDVNAELKSGAREGGHRRSRARSALLVAQAALSVVLLAGAGLFVRSLGNVGALPLGYRVDELVVASLSAPSSMDPGVADHMAAVGEVVARLEAEPAVSGVALSRHPPMRGYTGIGVHLPGRDSLPRLRDREFPTLNYVAPEFFAVTGVGIVEGRTFEPGEAGVVMVNETMARTFWPGESALGQCLVVGTRDTPCAMVVGVSGNHRRDRVIEEPALQWFYPLFESQAAGAVVARVDPARWTSVASLLQAELHARFPPRTVRVQRMSDMLEPQLRPWRTGAQLFTAFGLLALLVTVVGVYSVMTYAVSQRTHEMGVRIALGARVADVLRLVVGEGLRVIAVGVVVGIAVALALGRLVEALLFGVTPRDPLALAAAAAVLLGAGLLASLVPAWRAARVDPVRALAVE